MISLAVYCKDLVEVLGVGDLDGDGEASEGGERMTEMQVYLVDIRNIEDEVADNQDSLCDVLAEYLSLAKFNKKE